jgi:MFS family permease
VTEPATGAASVWRPLATPTFRNLLIADVVSDIGTFMQSVGAAWLMVSLSAGPMYVALTQTASTLPFFVLALPAGSVGDIVDRRKLILATETWMVAVATILAAVTLAGLMTPWLLLALTFALSAGDAFETPTWRAILPELVRREDLPAASALNGIEFNIARAVGPALAGFLVAAAGVGAAFAVNVLSFAGVILVVFRWKRTPRTRSTPPETLSGATVAAIRFVRFSPSIRALLVRSGVVLFFACGLLALLPEVASRTTGSAIGYGALLGCFGAGAIGGAVTMQRARAQWSVEAVSTTAVGVLGAAIVAASAVHQIVALGTLMLVAGGAWIAVVSLASGLLQALAPDWVRARVVAVYMLVSQGAMAAGSLVWGVIAARAGVETALLWTGVGTLACASLGLVVRMPDATADVSPWNHWRMPTVAHDEHGSGLYGGPVLVSVEYVVDPAQAEAFVEAMHAFGRVRRRDGASRWGIYRDIEREDHYLETFVVSSWAEHQRQHERLTRADAELEERLRPLLRGSPSVRHLIAPPG